MGADAVLPHVRGREAFFVDGRRFAFFAYSGWAFIRRRSAAGCAEARKSAPLKPISVACRTTESRQT